MDIIILNKNSMKLITVITFVILFLLSINQNDLKFQRNDWEINEITENVLKFNNGKMIETNLYNVGYVKTIYTNQKTPYLILSGNSCEKCDENISIYIHNPEKGNLDVTKSNKYIYPGNLYDYFDGKLIFSTKLFIGSCGKENESLIWSQYFHKNNNIIIKNFFVLTFSEEGIKESLFENFDFDEDSFCNQLEGKDFVSEP